MNRPDENRQPSGAEKNALDIEKTIAEAVRCHSSGNLVEAEGLYQSILGVEPNHAVALHLLGVIAHQVGKNDVAVELITKALQIKPDFAEAHNNLGTALKQLGRLDEALASYRKAIAFKADFVDAHYNAGLALRSLNKQKEAVDCFRKAISVNPNFTDAHYNLGVTLQELARLEDAVISYHKALSIKPDLFNAHYNLGVVYQGLNDLGQAEGCFRAALAFKSGSADAHYRLGNTLYELGRLDEAVIRYQKVLDINPNSAETHYNLGITYFQLNKLDKAITSYHKALAVKPDYPEVHSNLGLLFYEQKKYEEAEQRFRRAIAIQANYADAHNNLGTALSALSRLEEAAICYETAIGLKPDFAEAYFNLGNTLQALWQLDEAEVCLRKAIEIKPDYIECHWNLAGLLLSSENFEDGWKEHEWGLKLVTARPKDSSLESNTWQGEPLERRKLLVHAEQGIGDEVMYSSCIPDLIEKAPENVFLECDPRLEPLFARSFPNAHVRGRKRNQDRTLKEEWGPFECNIPIGSLPLFYRNSLEEFPKSKSFLVADPNKKADFRRDYNKRWPGKRLVGVSWSSSSKTEGDKKGISLQQLEPIFSQTDCQFINLQYGNVEEQLLSFKEQTGFNVFIDQRVDSLLDMDTFAAQVAALDLIVSISNTTVHIAGALGVPTWVLLPHASNWRWFMGRNDSLWYESVTLYRQETDCDWREVVERVRQNLMNLGETPSDEP